MATQLGSKSNHANNAKVMIGNTVIGEAVGISIQEDTGMDGLYVVGDIRAQEHNHNRLSVSFSINYIKFKKGALNKMGLGGVSMITLPLFDLHAYDRSDGVMQFKVKDCTMGGRSLSLNANQRTNGDVRGQGIYITPTDGAGQVVADTQTDQSSVTADAEGGQSSEGTAPGVGGAPVVV